MTELPRSRIIGLDSLRFLCAFSVVCSHLGGPPLIPKWSGGTADRVVHGVYSAMFPGAPAVIVFFLISGFCIHYPHRESQPFGFFAFYAQRFTRILVPMLVAIAILPLVDMQFRDLNVTILWSLYCELVYYASYPLIRLIWKAISKHRVQGMRILLGVSFVISTIIAITNRDALNYHQLGGALTSVLALPCWLLGALLAESLGSRKIMAREVWTWRAFAYCTAVASCVLRFHANIGFPITLTFFGLICFAWLKTELAWQAQHPPLAPLEAAGKWSYSLYLMHFPAAAFYTTYVIKTGLELADWCLMLGCVLLTAYLFYLFVELPSHVIARKSRAIFSDRATLAQEG